MQINELAELLAVSASTLRHWEKELAVDVPRDELGQRTYPPEWVAYFRQVKALLDAGKKYEEIKSQLTAPKPAPAEPPPPTVPPAELEELKQTVGQVQTGLKETVDQLAAIGKKLEGLAGGLAQLETSQTGTQKAIIGLQSEVQGIGADLKGYNKTLNQLQESVETLQDSQAGYSDEIAGLQRQITALQEAPGLPTAEIKALQTFKERFWWYMGAIVFLYMVLTISVIEAYR